jgi:hypothetical protein
VRGARSSTEKSLELHTKFWSDNIKGSYNTGDVPLDMKILKLKNVVFRDVVLCRSCVTRRFGGTSGHTRSTRRHIPEDDILRSHCSENLKS